MVDILIKEELKKIAEDVIEEFSKTEKIQHSDEIHCSCLGYTKDKLITYFQSIGVDKQTYI